jgi:hypothetical protein
MRRGLQTTTAILIGSALAGVFCFHVLRDPDTGWHLALGRAIQASGIPFRNLLSWTAPDEPFYPTSWLYDWLAATMVGHLGLRGLQILTLLFVVASIAGAALACARVNPTGGVWLIPAASLLIVARITERPHVASQVLLVWVLCACLPDASDASEFGRRASTGWKRRLACVPLIALFSNLHAGAAFPAVVLALFCAEAFFASGRSWREAAIGVAGLAALLANPGGLFDLRYLLANQHQGEVVPVDELAMPSWARAPDFYVVAVIALLVIWRTVRWSPAFAATTLLYGLLGLRAIRFVCDFELVVIVGLARVLATWKPRRLLWRVAVPAAVTAAAVALRVPMFQVLQLGARWDEQMLPVRAAEFVSTNRVAGRPFNAVADGGYLEWALPEVRWFQDTRIQAYPTAFFQEESDAEKTSGARLRERVKERGAEWALVSRQPVGLGGYHQFDAAEWALVYWDETSEVRVRRDVPRFAPLIAQLEYRHFRPGAPVNVAVAAVPELIEWEGELRRYEDTAPEDATAAIFHCAVLRRLGGESTRTCERADRLATTADLKNVLQQVRKLRQAGG